MTTLTYLRPSPFRAPVILGGFLLTAGCKDIELDLDGDGYVASEDCDDDDWGVSPSATEGCNGRDDDCDGEVDDGVLVVLYADDDGDGYGSDEEVIACPDAPDTSTLASDCDDSDASVHPEAAELCGNAIDDDCDQLIDTEDSDVTNVTWYLDEDLDGYGTDKMTVEDCTPPSGYIDQGDDCDDGNATIHPGAVETCDEIDSDCDGNDCSLDDGTICGSELAEPDAVLPVVGGSCDSKDGFVEFGGHCYLFVETAIAWTVARANCVDAGGYLATVADEDENAFIDEHTNNPWLGACDADEEGTWTSITGEPWAAFKNWTPGEPNDLGGEDCLEMWERGGGGGEWNDLSCARSDSYVDGYVCEFESADSP